MNHFVQFPQDLLASIFKCTPIPYHFIVLTKVLSLKSEHVLTWKVCKLWHTVLHKSQLLYTDLQWDSAKWSGVESLLMAISENQALSVRNL